VGDETRISALAASQFYRLAGAKRFRGCQDDSQTIDGVVHVNVQVQIFLNGFQEILLFAIAEPLVVRFVAGFDDLVGLREFRIGVELS